VSEPLRTDIQPRFADTDALGHLNNTAYALYVEQARLELFALLGATPRTLILANLAIDFRRQVDYSERVHVLTWVERIGNSSVGLRQNVYAEDELAAETRSVVVHFDYEANRSKPLDEGMRRALSRYLADALEAH
jgi:acyl-CoA thioester hydrolase